MRPRPAQDYYNEIMAMGSAMQSAETMLHASAGAGTMGGPGLQMPLVMPGGGAAGGVGGGMQGSLLSTHHLHVYINNVLHVMPVMPCKTVWH